MDAQGMRDKERLKDDYIAVSIRIDDMKREAKAEQMEWRRKIKAATEIRRSILARINGLDDETLRREKEPLIPGMEEAYDDAAEEDDQA